MSQLHELAYLNARPLLQSGRFFACPWYDRRGKICGHAYATRNALRNHLMDNKWHPGWRHKIGKHKRVTQTMITGLWKDEHPGNSYHI